MEKRLLEGYIVLKATGEKKLKNKWTLYLTQENENEQQI